MRWHIFLLLLVLSACASHEVKQPPEAEPLAPPVAENEASSEGKAQTEALEKEPGPPGTPVAGANYEMEKAKKEMVDTIEMIEKIENELILDCENDPQAFRHIAGFFNYRNFFQYNDRTFWFVAKDGTQIALNPEDGRLKTCKCGVWGFTKQLIAYQYQGRNLIETQFFLDEELGSLAVHHYEGDRLRWNKNYVLKGF